MLSHSRAERDTTLRSQKSDNADLLTDVNTLRRENHQLKRALAKAKDMVVQHLASRHTGEMSIERMSMLEMLGQSDESADLLLDEFDEDEVVDETVREKSAEAGRLSEQELELRSLREQVSFFLTQPMAMPGSTLPGALHSAANAPSASAVPRRRGVVGGPRGAGGTQPLVRWERSGNSMLRKTVPLPPV
jgi:hypothetical protein